MPPKNVFRDIPDEKTPKPFRPRPPKPPRNRSKRSRQMKVAAAQRKKQKLEARGRRRQAVRMVQKGALETLAEETFGPGGLTPARKEALSAVLIGPDSGVIAVNSAHHLRVLLNKAREKFLGHAERYMDTHVQVVEKAFAVGDLETAARHAEWAMDRFGVDGERVTDVPQKAASPVQSAPPQTVQVGVSLGGISAPKK